MSAATPSLRLPWTITDADEIRFRRIVKIALAITLVLSLLVPFLPLPTKTGVATG